MHWRESITLNVTEFAIKLSADRISYIIPGEHLVIESLAATSLI